MKIIDYYDFSQCICFFRKFTAKQIELSLFVLYGIYLILFIWDFAVFPWKKVRGVNAFLFIFSFILYIYELGILILIKIFRNKGQLFNERYKLMKIFGFSIYPSILVFIFFMLGSLICSYTDFLGLAYGNILNGQKNNDNYLYNKNSGETDYQKDIGQFYAQTFLYVINVLLCILSTLSFFLWAGENTLIKLREEKSFDYIEKEEDNENQNENNQPNTNNQPTTKKINVGQNELAVIIPGITVHKRKDGILIGFKEVQIGNQTKYEEVLGKSENNYLVNIYDELIKFNKK